MGSLLGFFSMPDKSEDLSEGPRALLSIFMQLAFTSPQLVLTQGSDSWHIEELLMQARQDRYGPAKKALEAPLYGIVTDSQGNLSIQNLKSGSITFSEVGSEVPAPKPS